MNKTKKTDEVKMTENEHRKLFKEHALKHCSLLASASCADIKLTLRAWDNGDITFEQALKLIDIAKADYLKNIEEGMWHEYLTSFDIETVWKNHIADVRKQYQK